MKNLIQTLLVVVLLSIQAVAQQSVIGLPMLSKEKTDQLKCNIIEVTELMSGPIAINGLGQCAQFKGILELISKINLLNKDCAPLNQLEAERIVAGVYQLYFGSRALPRCQP